MSKEESSSVQKLLASLQQAQKKEPVVSVNEPSTSKPKKNTNDKQKKRVDDKKKQKGASVGARMQQQQAENVKSQTKRPRQISTSKGGGRNASGSEYSQQQSVQQYPQSRGPRIPSDILDEIEFRFISNMIESEINDDIRVCFHLELAHWYYIDHMVEDNRYTRCPNVGTRDFTIQMCRHCRSLRKYAHRADEVIAKFREYKSSVPTYGAILVDSQLQNVILVQSYFAKGNNWGFPKGKINQNEPPRDAAIRETFEETGFDFGVYSEKEKKFQRFINDGMVRLYLVKNVPMDFKFEPQTRKEIRKIQWFKIDDLPTDKNDELPAYLQGYKFFMVMPFIRDIQSYIQKEREKLRRQQASAAPVASSSAKSTLPGASEQSILSQLFPSVTKSATNQNVTPNPPILKRLTSEELFSAFKSSPMPQNKESEISRPVLPDMSPSVNGLDTLALLGICTPLKAGASLNQFAAPPRNCPKINEEVEKNFKDHETEVGFAMPTDLQQPLVTTDHPWQQNRPLDSGAVPKTNDSHQGWLDTPLVNTIMHSPNLPIHSSHSPATPSTVLGHLIGKPIQPQPILPQPASQSALGSAEKPKSSKINLSDNSAFTAINSTQKQQSVPKATAAPGSYKVRSSSLSGSTKSKAIRGLFNSVTSPVSSDLPSVHGDDPHMWEEILLREQFAATAGTSISSLAASNQELAMINRDTPIENRNPYMNQIYQQIPNRPKCSEVPCCTQWAKKIQLDTDYIAGPVSSWMQQFSLHKK